MNKPLHWGLAALCFLLPTLPPLAWMSSAKDRLVEAEAAPADEAAQVAVASSSDVDEHGRRGRPGIAWRSGRLHSPSGLRTANLRMELADHLAFAGLINAHPSIQRTPGNRANRATTSAR